MTKIKGVLNEEQNLWLVLVQALHFLYTTCLFIYLCSLLVFATRTANTSQSNSEEEYAKEKERSATKTGSKHVGIGNCFSGKNQTKNRTSFSAGLFLLSMN